MMLYAVVMCDAASQPNRLVLSTSSSADDLSRWAGLWAAVPGAKEWSWEQGTFSRLHNLPKSEKPSHALALLWCGGSSFSSTISCLRVGWPRLSPGGIVLVSEYWKHKGCRRATDAYRREANVANPLYTVGERSRGAFGFAPPQDGDGAVEGGGDSKAEAAQTERRRAPNASFLFSHIEQTQSLAVNVSEESPLLKLSDKCCNARMFDPSRCCRPHAVFWQSG